MDTRMNMRQGLTLEAQIIAAKTGIAKGWRQDALVYTSVFFCGCEICGKSCQDTVSQAEFSRSGMPVEDFVEQRVSRLFGRCVHLDDYDEKMKSAAFREEVGWATLGIGVPIEAGAYKDR